MSLLQLFALPEVQALVATLAGFVWLTQVQAALPPWLSARIPAPLRAVVEAAAGNWGNAKNTQAPVGPASPLAALAITAICAALALGPAFLAQPAQQSPAPKNAAPAGVVSVELPAAVSPASLATDTTAN